MNRRNFLQGVIGGITSAGLLVKASDADILAFGGKEGAPAMLGTTPPKVISEDIGMIVFNFRGDPIGVITQAQFITEKVDISSSYDSIKRYVPGLSRMEYTVVSQGAVDVRLRK